MIRRLAAAVILFSLATGLRAETYQEWEKAVPDSRPIPFQAWLAPTTSSSEIHEQPYAVFESPLGHLFGHLDFSSYPPADFPLRVRVLYTHLDDGALNRIPNGFNPHVPDWTSPLKFVAPDADVGDVIESREVNVPSAAEGRAVPVWSIWKQSTREEPGGTANSYAVLVEIASHDGALLARQRLIEAVAGAPTRNVTLARTNSGAEPYVKTFGDLTTADELPTEEAVYEDVKVLWLDDATLHDPAYPDSFWHNVFFAGTLVLGRAPEVQELAQRLGLTPNQRVLQGGLWTTDHPADDLADQLKTEVRNEFGVYYVSDDKNPFKDAVVLGKKQKDELRSFSIWFLVSFTVFECVIIIGSIYLLHGYRRIFRWLLIPLSAIVYTAVGLFVVHLAVDFRPATEISREVESVEGWPESLVTTGVKRLGFNDDRISFTTPAAAAFSWFAVEPDAIPYASAPAQERMMFSMRQRYGRFSSAQIQYEQPAEIPCQVTADRQITAAWPLRVAWLWDGKMWRDLGAMEPGKPVAFDHAAVGMDPGTNNENRGYPSDSALPQAVRAMCNPAYMTSLQGTNVGLLLAIDDRAVPEQMDDAAGAEVHPQTLIVHQFQLPPAKP